MSHPRTTLRQQLLFAIIVWAVAEIVLQLHGICFWQEHGGTLGWLWSIAIGVIAVWSWLHDRVHFRWWVGGIASLLLLVGPLLQVGAPVVAQIEQRNTQQSSVAQRIELFRNAEAQQIASLKTYDDNSKLYRGWKPASDRVSAELATTRAALLDLLTNPPKARVAWLSWTVIVIQLVALILLQVAAVAALGTIRKIRADPSYQFMCDATLQTATQRNAAARHLVTVQRNTLSPLAEKIAAGAYGQNPKQRRVMAGEGIRRHPPVKKAFDELIDCGRMMREGQIFRLVG